MIYALKIISKLSFFKKGSGVTFNQLSSYRIIKELSGETMKVVKLLLSFVIFLFTSCAFVNVPIMSSTQPLEEQVIEGEGHYKILIIDITGTISDKKEYKGFGLKEKISPLVRLKEALQKAEMDDDIVGVIVKINSAGGTVTASDIMYHELLGFKERKGIPLYASLMDIGASGGYYVASASDEIFAHPTTITGSIGVIVLKFNVEDLFSKIGIDEESIKSGEKKDIMSPFRPLKADEKEIMQTIINQLHNRFIDVVVDGRNGKLTRQEVELLADGRIYTAEQAFKKGLIDQIGYVDDAIEEMKKTLDIEEARIVTYYRPGTYKATVYSSTPFDAEQPTVINLIGINTDGLSLFDGVSFMYLWKP
jgi:protease-4